MPLTDIAVREGKARTRAYKVADDSGLRLREKMLSAVAYPGTCLSQVGALAGGARKLVDQGKDPGAERVIAKKIQDNTFQTVTHDPLT